MRLAELHAAHTSQTYAYLFTWRSPAWDGQLGAGHVVEVPCVFGTHDAPDVRDLVPAGAEVGTLPGQMQDAAVGAACSVTPVAIWARCNEPVNREVATWRADALPSDWAARRDQWEYAHLVSAGFHALGLGALIAATLWDTDRS